jgi:hypothetical protein
VTVYSPAHFQDILLHFLFNLHWFGAMIGFLVSGTVIWPDFEIESKTAEIGVAVDWNTIESASVATGVSLFKYVYTLTV